MMVVVVASGPSLTVEDCALTQGHNVLSVSNTYEHLPHARWHYSADYPWWERHHTKVGIKFRYAQNVRARRMFQLRNPLQVFGDNSGSHAICLAVNLGASKIVLLGFDFQHTDGKAHYFGDHPPGMRNATESDRWVRALPLVLRHAHQKGVKIFNASRQTAIPDDMVPRVMLTAILTPDARA